MALTVCGALNAVYVLIVWRRARRTTQYTPVFEDWLWHVILPLAGYLAISVAALTLLRHHVASLFVIGGSAVLLLFVGIHNAWDTVTYIAIGMNAPPKANAQGAPASPPPAEGAGNHHPVTP